MKWNFALLVVVGLIARIQGDSLFNFWSHLIPGSRSSEENAINYTVHQANEESKSGESSLQSTSKLTSMLNPLEWFRAAKKPDATFDIDAELDTVSWRKFR